MWAYSFYNKNQNKFYLCRDRFGEKPLYYFYDGTKLYYGSNINYIFSLRNQRTSLNEEKISNFLSYGPKSMFIDNKTFFNEIKSLEASTIVSFDNKVKSRFMKYWHPKRTKTNKDISYLEATKIMKSKLKDSFSKRFRSDFPMACLLSGGVDSSSIAGMAKHLQSVDLSCYSIFSKDKNYDESQRIKHFSNKLNYKENFVPMNQLDNYSFLQKIISDTHFPLSTISFLVYAHLNKVIKKDGHRVLLLGNGGDEIYAGYYTHHMNYLSSRYRKNNFSSIYKDWSLNVKPYVRSKILSDFNYYQDYLKQKLSTFHEKDLIKEYLSNKNFDLNTRPKTYFKNFFRNRLAIDLLRDTLPKDLLSADQVSMYFSIENRCPFLSKDLFEFTQSLPDDYLIRKGYGKSILRDSMKKIVPKKILEFKEKIGFYANINNFFNLKSKKFRDILFQSNLVNKFIEKNRIIKLLDKKQLNNAEVKFIFCTLNLAILSSIK